MILPHCFSKVPHNGGALLAYFCRKTTVRLQPRRPFFSATFVVRCDSNEQLPSHWRGGCRWGRPLFRSAVHSLQSAKQPSVFNQYGRFSFISTSLSAAKAADNFSFRQVARLSIVPATAVSPQSITRQFNLDGRFSFFRERKKKSAVKRKKASHTAKEETPSAACGAESGVSFCLPRQIDSSRIAAMRHCTA